jgi:hypothetical protein
MSAMDCDEIRDALRAGGAPNGPEVDRHVGGCASCRLLLADEARLGRVLAEDEPAPSARSRVWAAVEEGVLRDRGPRAFLRSRPTGQRVALVLLAMLFVSAIGARGYHVPWSFWSLGWTIGFLILALVGVGSVLRPLGRSTLPPALTLVLVAATVSLPAVQALGEPAFSVTEMPQATLRRAVSCFFFGAALSAPVVALLWALDRAERIRSRGVVWLGAIGGLSANAALTLHCAVDDHVHRLTAHAPVGIALTLGLASIVAWRSRRAQSSSV